MEMPKFFLIVWANETNQIFFRDFMESMVAQVYDNWELYLLDDNEVSDLPRILSEFFPEDHRIHYKKLKNHKGQAYALNIGLHFVPSDVTHIMFLNQYDRLNGDTLFNVAQFLMQKPETDMLYTDYDEILGTELAHPHYLSDFNKELLYHCNYIGDTFVIAMSMVNRVGIFRERLEFAAIYDYYLRCIEKKAVIYHLPSILYHKRVMSIEDKKAAKKILTSSYQEHMAVIQSYFIRNDMTGIIEPEPKEKYWKISYPVHGNRLDSYQKNKKNYMVLHDADTKVYTRNAIDKMYGIIKQPDVAVVGIRYIKGALTVDNCGYIFDKEGMVYPALYDTKIYRETYQSRGIISQDVSAVDFAFCMMDKRIYKKLHGFDTSLSGRDLMLDYCIRARKAGYRIVIEPSIIGRKKQKTVESSETSYHRLMELHQETIEQGDPYYNPNLIMGLKNYEFLSNYES